MNTTFYNLLDSTLKNQIATTRWHLGTTNSSTSIYEKNVTDAYSIIYGNTCHWGSCYGDFNIGLPYVTDYGYGILTSIQSRSVTLGGYDNGKQGDNWIFNVVSTAGSYPWTVNSNHNSNVAYIAVQSSIGEIWGGGPTASYPLFPTFHLKNQVYLDGNHLGSASDPYRVSIL